MRSPAPHSQFRFSATSHPAASTYPSTTPAKVLRPLEVWDKAQPQEKPQEETGRGGAKAVRRKVDREMKRSGAERQDEKAARTQCVVGTLDVDIWRADGLIA